MNLSIFFDQVSEQLAVKNGDPGSIINNIKIFSDQFPDWKDCDIAIIGLEEERGSLTNAGMKGGADAIRRKFYQLRKGSSIYRICDFGNLRSGITLEDSYQRLKEVCEVLLQHNVIPLIIGGSQDMDLGQFGAYEHYGKQISLVNVDSVIDMSGSSDDMSRHHIHRMLVHQPNIIFHYCHLAYQTYLNDPELINVLEKLYFESFRIGELRDDIKEIEPAIRNADMFTFDISAIRQQDAPGNKNAMPFGLTGEEACQIAWYAGINSKLTSAGFYEYNFREDVKGQTAAVIATMLWYFIEGFYHRKNDKVFVEPDFVKYTVSISNHPHFIVFYKNIKNEKWWIEVPGSGAGKEKTSVVPCSYNDYLTATNGEVPNRWLMIHSKLF